MKNKTMYQSNIKYRGVQSMIFVMLSTLLIIGFNALSIMEERKGKKKPEQKEAEFEKEKDKVSNPEYDDDHKA